MATTDKATKAPKKPSKNDPLPPELESEDIDTDGADLEKGGPQTMWIRKPAWQKLVIIKEDIGGTWTRIIEIVCEQLLSSGLVSEEGREKVRQLTLAGNSELVDDKSWRNTFRIGEPWQEVAATKKQIGEELGKIKDSVNHLVEAVEDHAIAMLHIEHVEREEN